MKNLTLLVSSPLLGIALVAGCSLPSGSATPGTDARIDYYLEKTASHPRLYPAHAQLGAAFLQKAKESHDPLCLEKAHRALERSVEIQPNFSAFKAMADLCNFSHRFEEALRWADRAAEAFPR